MNRTVILSTNDDPNYFPYLEYVQKAWNILGWNTLTFYLGNKTLVSTDINQIVYISSIPAYKDCTVVQIYRLFGYKYISDGIIMTSDIDMMPLNNYWQPKYEDITCYGYDLTNYTQFPMCYIAANAENWAKLIDSDSITTLLSQYPYAQSQHFNDWWFADQLIITHKIQNYTLQPTIINRGLLTNGLAVGRVDRTAWASTRHNDSIKIDAHMPRPFSQDACTDLINNILIHNQ